MDVWLGVLAGALIGLLLSTRAVASRFVRLVAALGGRLMSHVTPEDVLEAAERDPYLGRDYARPAHRREEPVHSQG